jgi:FkbM family methyltransferase
MNNFEKNRSLFLENKISKVEFIDFMYNIHQTLFEYSDEIKNTSISKIEILDNKVIMTFRDSGVKLLCIPGDKRIACLDAINFKSYEEEELMMQYKLIQDNDVVIDIGGNYGWYCLHIAKKFPNSKVYTFEPIPNTYNNLQFNINLNKIINIIPINSGLSDNIGEFTFFCDPNLTVNASLNNVNDNPNAIKIVCNVDVLDNFVKERGINKVDFIKCDIEGAEIFALKGSINIIQEQKPKLFVEMLRKWTKKFDYHPNEIIDLLKNIGYGCFVITEGCLLNEVFEINENTVETNFVFLHKEKHNSLICDLKIS